MVQGRSNKIISMIKWLRTSRSLIKNSLSLSELRPCLQQVMLMCPRNVGTSQVTSSLGINWWEWQAGGADQAADPADPVVGVPSRGWRRRPRQAGPGSRVQGSGFRVQGAGFRVQGSGSGGWGLADGGVSIKDSAETWSGSEESSY